MESGARLSWSPRLGRWGRLTLQRTSSVACPRSFSEFWDDEVVPLICPTCQVAFGLAENASVGNHLATVHGVVFVFFCRGPAVHRRTGAPQIALAAILTINATSAVLNTNEMMPCTVAVRRMILSVIPTSETCAVMPITNEK